MPQSLDSPENKGHRVVRFPDRPRIWIDQMPLDVFCETYRAGNQTACERVETALVEAEKWVAKPDAWYLNVIWHREPRGYRTNACPIHPFRVRYYNYFDWSLDDPFRLYCLFCKDEGRAYDSYPNPRYPDDGNGCFPTDAVWREDHDEAWSRAHDGIPWDRWDGEVHGEMEPTNAYYFRGLCWLNAYLALGGNVLRSLGEAHHFALRLHADSDAAGRYAHKAQAILLTLSRAFMGDGYLSAVMGLTEDAFRAQLAAFYEPGTDVGSYSGYRPYTPQDHLAGDPKRPLDDQSLRRASIFPGIWSWKAGQAQALMTGYGLIAETFNASQRDLRAAALRIVTSVEGDGERARRADLPLRRGVLEYTLHPYALVSGGDNLSSSTQMPRLLLGRMVGDDQIIENVARDLWYFMHNFYSGDGMGKEGSPSYSSWNIASVMAACHGEKGNFDRTAPYADAATGALNLLGMPVFKHALGQFLHTGFPDGRPIPWEDCVIGVRMPLAQFAQVEALGGGIPDAYRAYLTIERDASGNPIVSLRTPLPLPSRVLGENRKGVLRSGTGNNARALALDFTERVGHYHMAPLHLTLFAKGRELATDLGYMGSDHFMTVDWIRTFPAHNTVAIRAADGDPMGTDHLRGDVRYVVDLPGVQAMDAAEEDASELAKVPGADRYQRSVAMIDADDEDAYVVDVFRATGGVVHDWTFHANGHRFETSNIALAPRHSADESLYDFSGFTFVPVRAKKSSNSRWGSQRVTGLRTGKSAGNWQATWSEVVEYPKKGAPPETDRDVFLKLHMLDESDSDVIVGKAPAQRWLDNRDLGETMTVVTVRRPRRETPNVFVAVHEPYRKVPFILSTERLPVKPADGEGVGMVATHRRGMDLVLFAQANGQVCRIETGGYALSTDGELAVASFDAQGLRALSVVGGQFAECAGQRVNARPTATGILADFDDQVKCLTVISEAVIPEGKILNGQVVTIRHRERTSAFTIQSAEKTGDNMYRLHLDGWPHLATGYLRAVDVEPDRVWVEPPPVLQGKTSHLNVFRVDNDRHLTFLQPLSTRGSDDILCERGMRIRTRFYFAIDDTSQIAPGSDIALSPMHPGVDHFRIFGSGQWRR